MGELKPHRRHQEKVTNQSPRYDDDGDGIDDDDGSDDDDDDEVDNDDEIDDDNSYEVHIT